MEEVVADPPTPTAGAPLANTAREVGLLFLRLGLTAFGGPVAHVALMRDEVVRRRGWLGDEDFLDLVGATNLLPGPNSTELALALGARRAGRRGLLAAGVAFILPAALIVLALAWLYVSFGSAPPGQAILAGVKPVVIAIVCVAIWSLGRRLAREPLLLLLAIGCAAAYLLGVQELALLALGAVVGLSAWGIRRSGAEARSARPGAILAGLLGATGTATASVTLPGLFAVFLKVGALLYGSGYVLLAFLRSDLVERLGWLSDRQLLDAVAIGQATPGPVFTTATFVGYVLAGVPGAAVATVAIFLPAFLFVGLLEPLVRLARARPWTSSALDGVSAASLGLMGGVTAILARDALTPGGRLDPPAVVLALGALALLLTDRLGSTVLITLGAAVGLARLAVAS